MLGFKLTLLDFLVFSRIINLLGSIYFSYYALSASKFYLFFRFFQ